MIGFPSAPSIAPSQSPVPVGLIPDLNPSPGASRVIVAASGIPLARVPFAGVGLFGGVELAGVELFAGEELLAGGLFAGGFAGVVTFPLLIACCKAPSLVDANGQPFPGPFKFWMVIDAAVILPDSSCFESPVGKETLTVGLLTANPAWTFLISA